MTSGSYDQTASSLLPLSTIPRRKPSKSQRVLRNLAHPLRSRQERKARKLEKIQKENEARVANIDDFLEGGRIFYERQYGVGRKYGY
ncbi:hypothetical protein L873DRAFT_1775548 [Choiromyces venosus 120613-1]|uniref:Uncharacterized protein n=1 Tax=Choiromyces venosus 120613-1 TaxID=1336337 RepID=A0A3N4J9K5_9PEZI|nr:hypothetical protein L873DRAFT_1775548 [Choiromyces venosus 120613-1]